MDNSNARVNHWTDLEIMGELERHTGDLERDIEREAIRRLMEKVNALMLTNPDK
jgi:hypothetical protein